jgi:hypothetical protein
MVSNEKLKTPSQTMRSAASATGEWAAIHVDKAAAMPIGQIVSFLLGAFVGIIPLIIAVVPLTPYALLHPFAWLYVWVALFLVERLVDKYKKGKRREGEIHRFDEIHSSLAGTVDRLGHALITSPQHKLDTKVAQSLCIALLSRVKDYALKLFPNATEARLRVTLAVPWNDPKQGGKECLRVWCYDEPYIGSN